MWQSGWVGRLNLRYSTPADVGAWLTHPQMAGVEGLELTDAGVEVAEMIATAELLITLGHLSLAFGRLGANGVRTLVSAKLPALRELTLFDTNLGDDGAGVIATAPALASLTDLDLADNEIGPAGARALAASPHLTRLQSLRLSYNAIGDDGAAAVFGSPAFAELRSLDLDGTELSSVQALCRSSHLRNLTSLNLSNNPLSPTAAGELANCSHLTGLIALMLPGTRTREDGVRSLAESPHLPDLRELDLSSNPIGDTGLIALVSSPLFARLDKLSLGKCGITVVGLRALAASPRFADPRPLELWLTDNAFGEEVQAEADGWPKTLAATVRNALSWAIDMR